MSRRRYISTEISVDKRINNLSDFAALLYTWMIPHADDDGTITSDPDELAWIVVPGRRRKTPQISEALMEMVNEGLILSDGNGRLYFPFESFYKYQTYIPPAKRRVDDPISEERRKTPKNAASPSLSPSPSPSLSPDLAPEGFDEFWSLYPRRVSKGQAQRALAAALKKTDINTILAALERQLPDLNRREKKYIPYPSTWLNGECWEDDVTVAPTEHYDEANEALMEELMR